MTRDEAEEILERELENLGKRKTAEEMQQLNEARRILTEELEEILESLPDKIKGAN